MEAGLDDRVWTAREGIIGIGHGWGAETEELHARSVWSKCVDPVTFEGTRR